MVTQLCRDRVPERSPTAQGEGIVSRYQNGQQALARQAVLKIGQANRQWHQDPAPLYATAYSGMGQKDEALAWLEKAYAKHSNVVSALKVDPIYDPLRSDPRFQDLLRRVGFNN